MRDFDASQVLDEAVSIIRDVSSQETPKKEPPSWEETRARMHALLDEGKDEFYAALETLRRGTQEETVDDSNPLDARAKLLSGLEANLADTERALVLSRARAMLDEGRPAFRAAVQRMRERAEERRRRRTQG